MAPTSGQAKVSRKADGGRAGVPPPPPPPLATPLNSFAAELGAGDARKHVFCFRFGRVLQYA